MHDRNTENQSFAEPLLDLPNANEASYEALSDYLSAKRKLFLSQPKGKKRPIENTQFLQACSQVYHASPRLFSEDNYGLLKRHAKLAEEIISELRPATLKALFGNAKDSHSAVENRLYILSVLHKKGILRNINGKINDQDWLPFLNTLNSEKLDHYANVFELIEPLDIPDPIIFSQLKAHNDLEQLPAELSNSLLLNAAYGNQNTLPSGLFPEESQIKGFTLINEHICKRTRFFPKAWKIAMKNAWNDPSVDASFELYKLYSERLLWLSSFIAFPVIYRFLSYFYTRPIFQTFDQEPLTQASKVLQSHGVLTKSNFNIIADMTPLQLSFCAILASKSRLSSEYLSMIKTIPEPILQNIFQANAEMWILPNKFDVILKLAQKGIDATPWIIHRPNWVLISNLSDQNLKLLDSLELNAAVFERLNYLHTENRMPIFDYLNAEQQKEILTLPQIEKILPLLQHLKNIDLFTPENIQFIFNHQKRLIEDENLSSAFLNLEKSTPIRAQKKLNQFMQVLDRSGSPRVRTASQSRDAQVITITSDHLPSHLSQKLRSEGFDISADDLEPYSPVVLQAFHAVLPLLKEDNLLNQQNLKSILSLFNKGPDPKIRSRCIIILAQCGLLTMHNLINKLGQLELIHKDNPQLFREMYAEAWVTTETSRKWLEKTIENGLQETEQDENAEETLIQRYLIENEENGAYLALDDTKQSVARHAYAPMLQQAMKLLDKSSIAIESVFDDLQHTNAEQIQKVYAWLTILDKAQLLDANNAKKVVQHCQSLPADVSFLKATVASIKAHPEIMMNTALKQKSWDQLLSENTTASNKQKILDYMTLSINNPSAAAKIAFMVSDVADIAGEKAFVVQDQFKRTAGSFAASATDMGQKVLGKIRLFSAKQPETPKPTTVPDFLDLAIKSKQFQGSFYQTHQENLQIDLSALLYQDLLTESNMQWLMEQPNQAITGRCLRLLAKSNMLRDEPHWQSKVSALAACDLQELLKLENKCQGVFKSQESKEIKESTVQMWIEPIVCSHGHAPRGAQ